MDLISADYDIQIKNESETVKEEEEVDVADKAKIQAEGVDTADVQDQDDEVVLDDVQVYQETDYFSILSLLDADYSYLSCFFFFFDSFSSLLVQILISLPNGPLNNLGGRLLLLEYYYYEEVDQEDDDQDEEDIDGVSGEGEGVCDVAYYDGIYQLFDQLIKQAIVIIFEIEVIIEIEFEQLAELIDYAITKELIRIIKISVIEFAFIIVFVIIVVFVIVIIIVIAAIAIVINLDND
ncbi:MAG: hypothetical protein EZS28_030070 [Streblomastix strix]|uniref:Uncharacterized protein n=1 Tax=Streblomastix strix TaxID=222440 RepID=A0A5J4UVS2_9EUKA|nr:MAG: hypothetical protein EZS28_030070 [Streblomastix strix]